MVELGSGKCLSDRVDADRYNRCRRARNDCRRVSYALPDRRNLSVGPVESIETQRPVRPKWSGWDRENACQTEWMQTGQWLQTDAGRCKSRVGWLSAGMQCLSAGVLHSSRSKKFGKGLVGSVETLRPVEPKWPSWDRENDRQTEWMQAGTMTADRHATVVGRHATVVGRHATVVGRHATTADACLTLFPIEEIVSSTCRIDRNFKTGQTKMAGLGSRKCLPDRVAADRRNGCGSMQVGCRQACNDCGRVSYALPDRRNLVKDWSSQLKLQDRSDRNGRVGIGKMLVRQSGCRQAGSMLRGCKWSRVGC
jgi:hypothetical protein